MCMYMNSMNSMTWTLTASVAVLYLLASSRSLSLTHSRTHTLSLSPSLSLFLFLPTADTPYIIFGNREAIHQVRLNGTNRIELQQRQEEDVDIRGLDFDFKYVTLNY